MGIVDILILLHAPVVLWAHQIKLFSTIPVFSRRSLVIPALSPGGSLEGIYHLSFCVLLVSTPLRPVSVVSPLKPEVFAAKLSQHPDQNLVAFVLDRLRNGFRLGFQHSKKLKSAKSNEVSANQHSEVVDRYLPNDVSLGRVAGPFSSPPLPNLHVSSFGVIPKKGQPGKWRLIVDLSCSGCLSINDGIDPDKFTNTSRLIRSFV